MKYKKETITIAVKYTVEYDATREGARDHAIKCAVKELPHTIAGASTAYGGYYVKRGRGKLMEETV
jgi:hypothetical protein